MTLLLDQNLSFRLAKTLQDLFTTDEIEEVIRSNRDQLRTFGADAEAAFLALS